jgi:hypothetical protein
MTTNFERGCRMLGGEFEEKPRTLVCVLNDVEKIVVDKKGAWVKSYLENNLRTWSKPTKVIVDETNKTMEIFLISGNSIFIEICSFPWGKIPTLSYDPEEKLPEYEEAWMKRRMVGAHAGRMGRGIPRKRYTEGED